MQEAEQLIAQQNLTGRTAQTQEQVLSDLDALIAQCQQQSQSQSSSQSQSQSQQRQASQRNTPQSSQRDRAGQRIPGPSTAARTSSDRTQSSSMDDATERGPQELLKDVWGQLPERVRQQLLQSSTDEFLPQYREDIERYFRRLAEEESGSGGQSER